MSTVSPVSDLQLQELAEEPASDLFPLLTSAVAFAPWVVVLAFLPSLVGLFYWNLDERSAAWGLRALAASDRAAVDHLGRGEIETPALIGAPPLETWLTRIFLVGFQVPMPLGLVSVSYLAAAVTVVFAAKLSQRLGVPRLMPLAVLSIAGSPLLINSAHAAGPAALGLCLLTISLERFLAHLEHPLRRWSGRLFVSALAWGGAWLALGWPALSLGFVLSVPVLVPTRPRLDRRFAREFFVPPPTRTYRRSLVAWWILGLLSGGWWTAAAIMRYGWSQSVAWLFFRAPSEIPPALVGPAASNWWGATVGLMFLLGWIGLGLLGIFLHPRAIFGDVGPGRSLLIVAWWFALLVGRLLSAAAGADVVLWDVLQTVPAGLIAAMGMELVIQRAVSARELVLAVILGLVSLAVHIPRLEVDALQMPLALAAIILAAPIVWSIVQFRSFRWPEQRRRRVLQSLLLSTWLAQLTWGISQSIPESSVERQLATQLAKLRTLLPAPAAVVVVTPTTPSYALEFQLRRTWPQADYVMADRWDTAVTKSGPALPDWARGECVLVELSQRDTQTRRPGTEWTVTALAEPRRYFREQLTFLSVRADRR